MPSCISSAKVGNGRISLELIIYLYIYIAKAFSIGALVACHESLLVAPFSQNLVRQLPDTIHLNVLISENKT